MNITINKSELLDEITNKSKPIFYNAEKLALSVDLANSSSKPNFVKQVFEIYFEENESGVPVVGVGGTTLEIPSHGLSKHLEGCNKVALFCVTLGHGADREIERAKSKDMELAVLLDIAFLLLVEKACDKICFDLKNEYTSCELTPRYSLGYEDSPLELQSEFLNVLNAEKRIGVLVTDGGMMLPTKSVTAMIGIK